MSSATVPKIPEPPSNFASREPEVYKLRIGNMMSRFFNNSYTDPLYFDRSADGRFNATLGSYGVNYAAKDKEGAFAECFLRSTGRQSITRTQLDSRGYTEILVLEEMRLVMIGGRGLARIGATAEITASRPPYKVPQIWSGAVYDHPAGFDGITYYSRHDNSELCFALFERSQHKFTSQNTQVVLNDDMIDELLEHYQIGLLPF